MNRKPLYHLVPTESMKEDCITFRHHFLGLVHESYKHISTVLCDISEG